MKANKKIMLPEGTAILVLGSVVLVCNEPLELEVVGDHTFDDIAAEMAANKRPDLLPFLEHTVKGERGSKTLVRYGRQGQKIEAEIGNPVEEEVTMLEGSDSQEEKEAREKAAREADEKAAALIEEKRAAVAAAEAKAAAEKAENEAAQKAAEESAKAEAAAAKEMAEKEAEEKAAAEAEAAENKEPAKTGKGKKKAE